MIINFDRCCSFNQVHRSAISIHVNERKHIKRTKSMASSFFSLRVNYRMSFSFKMFINESYRVFLFDVEREKLVKLFN